MYKAKLHSGPCVAVCVCAIVSACAPSLSQNPPRDANKEVPADFGATPGAAKAASAADANVGLQSWNQFFTDPNLKQLIDTALANNQELNIRVQEIIVANAEVLSRTGEYLPKVGAGVGGGVDKRGEFTSRGRSDEVDHVPVPTGDIRFGLFATWEVDIWKKLHNAAKSAQMRYLATIQGKNFLVTQLVAEIAKSYYELLALDNQLEVLKRNIKIQQDALAVVRYEKEAARATQLAVQRFEAEVLKNQGRQFYLEQQIVQTQNKINFLVGRYPQPVARNSESFNDPVPEVVRAGIPSQLLDNRPDVKQAELELEAAKLDVSVAKKNFYPSLSIDAGVGYETFNPKHLVSTPESLAFNLAGNLVAPLLNRRAIKAQYFSANAQQIQAVFNYERTLLQAFTEVANQVSMIDNLQKSYDLESKQVALLVDAIDVANVLFQSARADYMDVLLTQTAALTSQMELVDTKLRQMQAVVNIYQALGGGWR